MIGELLSVGGSIGSIYSAISAIATGRFQKRVIELLEKKHQTFIRIAEGILYSPQSRNVVSSASTREITEIDRIKHLLSPVHDALKTDIISSTAFLTPSKLKEEFERDPWSCLNDIKPARLARYDKSSDWVPIAFVWENQIYIGWQLKGMLHAVLGVDFHASEDAWLNSKNTMEDFDANITKSPIIRSPYVQLGRKPHLGRPERASRADGPPIAPPVERDDDQDMLGSLSVDIARMIDHEAASGLWERYRRGERGIFTRQLYTLQGQKVFDQIRERYRADPEFRKTVENYIREFEDLLDDASRGARGPALVMNYLTDETGKVYTILAHAAGRFDL